MNHSLARPAIFLTGLIAILLPSLALAADPSKAVQEHVGKLDQWFTVNEAAKLAGKPANEAKVEYLKSEKHPTTEVVDYSWKGGRTRMTTGAVKMKLPVADSIKVGWLRRTTLQEMQDLRSYIDSEDLPEVGEFAILDKNGLQHIFFKKGVRFSVWVNISDDPAVNTAKAVETARLLLAKL